MTRALARRITYAWLIGIAAIFIAYLITQALFDDGLLWQVFHIDGELNVAAWFSTLELGFAALIWVLIVAALWDVDRKAAIGGVIVVVALLFVSLDEATAIHERVADVNLGPTVSRTFWVFLYFPLALGVAIAVIVLSGRALLAHRRPLGFLVAGALLYAFSVGVVELMLNFTTPQTAPWFLQSLIEESGEMLGVTLALYGSMLLLVELKPAEA